MLKRFKADVERERQRIGNLSRNLWGSGQERLSRTQRCTGLEKHELDRPDLTQENEHPACVHLNGIKA